jgi:Cu+-exporting ATPase
MCGSHPPQAQPQSQNRHFIRAPLRRQPPCAPLQGRTSAALAALAALVPDTATLVVLDEATGAVLDSREVPSALIHRGDVLRVLPGAKVPTDGVIVEGQSYLNEAMVTGESAPRWKRPGEVVIGGTINTSNPLLVRATRVSEGSAQGPGPGGSG